MTWLAVLLMLIGVLAFIYFLVGLTLISIYDDEVTIAFRRDCKPFKPNQLWMVKTMMLLFWPTIKWEEEVLYYDTGLPKTWGYRRSQ